MIPYRLIRKKRKTLSVRIEKDGSVTVSVPTLCSRTEIEAFLQKNLHWIEEKQAERIRLNARKISFSEGDLVPFFGREYPLALREKRGATQSDGVLYLPADQPQKALERLYRTALKETLTEYIAVYAARMNVCPTGLKITSATTRWGSCSGKNALCFSYRLAMCEKSAIEYVVVHELCHILHKNHSKAFWQAVARYYPEYRSARKYLKDNARFMDLLP